MTIRKSDFTRQSKANAKNRRDCVMRWLLAQYDKIKPDTARKNGSTQATAYAVLVAFVKASPTGDFCNVRQATIAKNINKSVRAVQRAIKTLKECGLMYVKHNYKKTPAGSRRTVSHTVIAAFRKQYDKIKQYLNVEHGIACAEKITALLLGHSQHVIRARQFNSFFKAPQKRVFADVETGELLSSSDAAYLLGMEYLFQLEGV